MMAAFPERGFEAEHLAEPLPFGPIFEAAFIDRSQDGTCARAGVGSQDLLDVNFERSFLDDIALTQYIEGKLGHGGLRED
jgi:hypothetical protein